MRRPSDHKLIDFVTGNLSREESRKIIAMAEKDKKLSRQIEFMIDVMNSVEEFEGLGLRKKRKGEL